MALTSYCLFKEMESNGPLIGFQGYPGRELKELDLISKLELGSGEESDGGVDCTLKLAVSSAFCGKKPLTDVNPPPQVMQKQNHGVMNGAYGYSNNRFGNVDGSNMNWEPTNPSSGYSHGYCYGSSSSDAAPAIPTACNNDYLRVQALPGHPNNVPIAGMFPRRKKPCLDTRGRICTVCRSTSTPLWRNGPRGVKSLCNACGIRFKKEERKANGHSETRSRARRTVPNEPAATRP